MLAAILIISDGGPKQLKPKQKRKNSHPNRHVKNSREQTG